MQVLDQAAHRGVEDRQDPLHSALEAGMKVPAAEGQRDEPHARLDQPAGQECALAPLVAAVAVAQPRVFLAHVEGVAGRVAQDHREGLLLEPVEAVHQRRTHRRRAGLDRTTPARSAGPGAGPNPRRLGSARLGTR